MMRDNDYCWVKYLNGYNGTITLNQIDEYEDQIITELPVGTIVNDNLASTTSFSCSTRVLWDHSIQILLFYINIYFIRTYLFKCNQRLRCLWQINFRSTFVTADAKLQNCVNFEKNPLPYPNVIMATLCEFLTTVYLYLIETGMSFVYTKLAT